MPAKKLAIVDRDARFSNESVGAVYAVGAAETAIQHDLAGKWRQKEAERHSQPDYPDTNADRVHYPSGRAYTRTSMMGCRVSMHQISARAPR